MTKEFPIFKKMEDTSFIIEKIEETRGQFHKHVYAQLLCV